jgi:hypothetical protein
MGSLNTKEAAIQATRNVVYFENEHDSTGLGPASLVARVKHMTASKSRSVNTTESLFVLLNTWLVNDLGPKQLAVYTSLISHLTSTNSHVEMSVTPPITGGIFVPLEVKETKRDLISGSRSIMMNLARPYTHTLRNGYSYVSCIDSLACLLSSGVKIEPMVGRLSSFLCETEGNYQLRFNADTPRGAEIQANAEATFGAEALSPLTEIPTLILLGFLWSDSFEPNATKQNRGSVHAFLLTFSFNQDDPHSGSTTVLLALGPGDAPTDDVESLLKQELDKMMSPVGEDNLFYVGEARRVCRVFLQLFSLQEDRIERQSVTRSLAGNSNTTARWGWIADLYYQQNFLPSCSICYQGLLANVDTGVYRQSSTCCANWDMEGLTYPPPPGYPMERLPVDRPILTFSKLTFEGMDLACTEAFDKVSRGFWKVSSAEIFLKTEGVNAQYGAQVVNAASNRLKLNKMNQESAEYRSHLLLSTAFNSSFPVEQPRKPATWCYPGVSLVDHIDVIMHLLFLGIISTVLKETFFPWLKAHRLMTDLAQLTRRPLSELDLMRLVWCKAQVINDTGTLGGSVSENYLAYCRLGKWLFGCSTVLKERDPVYSDPVRPKNRYTIAQVRAWYNAREIVVPRLDNEELKAQFLNDNNQAGGPPPIPEKGEAGISRETTNDLINSMVALVAHVMVEGQVGDQEVWAVERHVKLFLSTYERFDGHRRRKIACRAVPSGQRRRKNKAAWISHMNFASLLNLPGVMRRYGSLRVLWEGDRKGEGGLPRLKSKVKKGVTGNWSASAARAVVSETALERAIESAASACDSASAEASVQQLLEAAKLINGQSGSRVYKNYKVYDDEQHALRSLLSGSPVSIAGVKSRTGWYIVLKGRYLLPINRVQGNRGKVVGGAAYFKFEAGVKRPLIGEFGEVDAEVLDGYALLLPELATGEFQGSHYLITSKWEEMNVNGAIVRYQMEGADYS